MFLMIRLYLDSGVMFLFLKKRLVITKRVLSASRTVSEFGTHQINFYFTNYHYSRVDKQRNEPGRWKSRIVAIFLLFLTLLHVLT